MNFLVCNFNSSLFAKIYTANTIAIKKFTIFPIKLVIWLMVTSNTSFDRFMIPFFNASVSIVILCIKLLISGILSVVSIAKSFNATK